MLDDLHQLSNRIRDAVGDVVVGQEAAIEDLLIAWLAGGHVLLEGVPGVGKTLLARSFAQALGLEFGRIQFTPDLMPSDVTGGSVYDFRTQQFRVEPGPVFCQVLLGDELNRAPPRTQSALLEAMQERQVTLDGQSRPLDPQFFVLATQNPVEQEGTWPLPEAQLDRFLLCVRMAPPGRAAELTLYKRFLDGRLNLVGAADTISAVATADALAHARGALGAVHVDSTLLDYLHALVDRTRTDRRVLVGVSPRGALALLGAARARAVVHGRDFVMPDDVKDLAVAALAHRLVPTPDAELEGRSAADLVRTALDDIEVPR